MNVIALFTIKQKESREGAFDLSTEVLSLGATYFLFYLFIFVLKMWKI